MKTIIYQSILMQIANFIPLCKHLHTTYSDHIHVTLSVSCHPRFAGPNNDPSTLTPYLIKILYKRAVM